MHGTQQCGPVNLNNAGIAQLVERNLAKVEVASSNLVSRSRHEKGSQCFPFLSGPSRLKKTRRGSKAVMHRIANPSRSVRLRPAPPDARYAGIAQLVERNLAKVEVASSNLVSRSISKKGSSGFPFLMVIHLRITGAGQGPCCPMSGRSGPWALFSRRVSTWPQFGSSLVWSQALGWRTGWSG